MPSNAHHKREVDGHQWRNSALQQHAKTLMLLQIVCSFGSGSIAPRSRCLCLSDVAILRSSFSVKVFVSCAGPETKNFAVNAMQMSRRPSDTNTTGPPSSSSQALMCKDTGVCHQEQCDRALRHWHVSSTEYFDLEQQKSTLQVERDNLRREVGRYTSLLKHSEDEASRREARALLSRSSEAQAQYQSQIDQLRWKTKSLEVRSNSDYILFLDVYHLACIPVTVNALEASQPFISSRSLQPAAV